MFFFGEPSPPARRAILYPRLRLDSRLFSWGRWEDIHGNLWREGTLALAPALAASRPPSPPCFWRGVFKELPRAPDLPRWQRWNCCSEAKQAGRFHPPVLLSSFTSRCPLSCPAVTGCRLSQTQCFSCLLSSLGVRCECTRDAKTVCVRECKQRSAGLPQHQSVLLSPFLPLSLTHTLSTSVFPSHVLALSLSLSHSLLISHCRLREQSTSLHWPANQSAWEWVTSQQPRPDVERENRVVRRAVGGLKGTV